MGPQSPSAAPSVPIQNDLVGAIQNQGLFVTTSPSGMALIGNADMRSPAVITSLSELPHAPGQWSVLSVAEYAKFAKQTASRTPREAEYETSGR